MCIGVIYNNDNNNNYDYYFHFQFSFPLLHLVSSGPFHPAREETLDPTSGSHYCKDFSQIIYEIYDQIPGNPGNQVSH